MAGEGGARVFSNRYEIVREIARGGMAEVYLARDRLLDRPVALKVLFAELSRDPSFVERFRREAQAAAGLNFPGIVSIYDWGQEEGTYFIVMEYVEGRSLREVLKADGTLPPTTAADIAADIAAALSYAHQHGVVHRDVKPGNVLITPNGDVKVADFGIAQAGTGEGLTQTGSVMGTATYFSPEQAQALPVDGRSDVYSLGVVLYETVCGVAPFSGENPVSVAYQHVKEMPIPPSRRAPGLPPALDRIIGTALQKDPARRYQSADEMRADLLRFLRDRPVHGGPVTAIATGVAATRAVPTARRSAPNAVLAPPRKRNPWGVAAVIAILVLLAGAVGFLVVSQARDASGSSAAVTVPDVTRTNVIAATARLRKAGLAVSVRRVPSDTEVKDLVLSQNPEPGTKLHKGEPVDLTVSNGPAPVTITDVTGKDEATARSILEGQGFTVTVTHLASDTVPPGNVIGTQPPANSSAPRGSAVVLVVSNGAEQLTVPDVTGQTQSDATNALVAAGFKVTPSTRSSDTVSVGLVISTQPSPSSTASKGSTVTIVVSTGPAQATVPDVRLQDQASASSNLSSAGFAVSVSSVPSTPARKGLVVSQSPSGGASAAKGSTVTINVGDGTL